MEFILKLEEFSHLRDVPEMPESICPCHEQAMPLLKTYIDQVMSVHKHVKYLHIGCDEVFHLGECSQCLTKVSRLAFHHHHTNMKNHRTCIHFSTQGQTRSEIFVDHVKRVAGYVRQTYGVNVIIWDDMLRNFMPEEMEPLADIVQVSPSAQSFFITK